MDKKRAKFILNAYRPNQSDRDDPEIREALALVREDSELRSWFEEQLRFDREVVRALEEIPVPGDLYDNILHGVDVSREDAAGGSGFRWATAVSALAAVILIGVFAGLAGWLPLGDRENESGWQGAILAAVLDLTKGRSQLDLVNAGHTEVYGWLQAVEPSLESALALRAEVGGAFGCKEVHSEDGLVTIVCFERDGRMFHLASYRLGTGENLPGPAQPAVQRMDQWLAAVWSSGEFAHMLLTSEEGIDPDAIRRVARSVSASA